MASQRNLGTGEEHRIAWDARQYTLDEFREYYGENWRAHWDQAPIATTGGAAPVTPATCGDPGG